MTRRKIIQLIPMAQESFYTHYTISAQTRNRKPISYFEANRQNNGIPRRPK